MRGKSTILGGALLLTASNVLLRLISIFFNAYLKGQIGAAGLGLLQLISTVGLFAALVGASGVRVSAMVLSAEEFGHRRLRGVRTAMATCLRYGLILSSVVGTALFFASEVLAAKWLGDLRAALSLRWMGLLLPFSCLCGILTGYFTACSRIRQIVGIEIAERLVSLVLTMVLLRLWAGQDLEKACCAITLGSSLGAAFDCVLLYRVYRRDMRGIRQDSHLSMGRRLLRLCVPLALNDYLRSGLNTAEQLLIPYGLARYSGSGESAMAAYGTIQALVFPVLLFPASVLYSLSDLLVPELSRAKAMGRIWRIRDLTDKCLRLCLLFAATVAGCLYVTAPYLGQWLYHSAEAGRLLQAFAPMVLMLYLDALTDGMLKGLAEQLPCVRYNTLSSVLDVVLLPILLPRWGIGGYVACFVVTHAINLALSLRRLLKVTGHRFRRDSWSKPLLCLILTLSACHAFPTPYSIAAFLPLLLSLYTLTNALPPPHRHWLRSLLKKI